MKILVDLNVLLDFLQRREPFFEDAASILDGVLYRKFDGVLAVHAITTAFYLLSKSRSAESTRDAVQWLIDTFEIPPCDKGALEEAMISGFADFEDAVTSVQARRSGCEFIVTRNRVDFARSAVPAITPAGFLLRLQSE